MRRNVLDELNLMCFEVRLIPDTLKLDLTKTGESIGQTNANGDQTNISNNNHLGQSLERAASLAVDDNDRQRTQEWW